MPEHLNLYHYTAAVLAAILLLYGFLRKSPLDKRPEEGSNFAGLGEHLRLRDLFRVAVMMEEEGMEFYKKMAERAQVPGARKLCLELADEELAHRELFAGRLAGWRSLPPNSLTWPAFIEKVKEYGIFAAPPGDQATEDQLAAFAIRQELKSAAFYRMFEPAFPEAWKREELEDLVRQELSHEARLRAAYPHLR
jgi:rubrerythrin